MDADLAELDEFMAQSNAKAQRGREIARALVAAVLVLLAFVAILFLNLPNTMGGPFFEPSLTEWIVPGLGVLGILVGLAWMVRIIRADPEPDSSAWRYRER
jgi:protein-S-isoprenylcysteine O-methyltransferase Ste14